MSMSKALEYVIANLERFTTFHLLLVVLLAGLVSAGMFFVFRWLYQERLVSQAGLLSLRTDELAEYRRRYDLLTVENSRSQEAITIAIAPSSAAVDKRQDSPPASVELVWALMQLNHLRERIDIARRFLTMYATVFPLSGQGHAPKPQMLIEMLDRTVESLGVTELDDRAFDAAMSVAAGAPNAAVPEQLLTFPFDEKFGEIDAVLRETGVWISRTIDEAKNAKPAA
jgi:hypothetical protein